MPNNHNAIGIQLIPLDLHHVALLETENSSYRHTEIPNAERIVRQLSCTHKFGCVDALFHRILKNEHDETRPTERAPLLINCLE
jgi:hypothetical protein